MLVAKNGFWGFIPTRETHTEQIFFFFFFKKKGTLGETTQSWLSQLREVNSPDGEYNINETKGQARV